MPRAVSVPVPLTNEQRKLVEDYHNLIYSFLRKNKLQVDEWYGVAAIGLCKAAKTNDPTRGFSFSTLAYRSMQNIVSSELKKLKTNGKRTAIVSSLDYELADDFCLHDVVSDNKDSFDEIICQIDWDNFYASLSEKEKQIVMMKSQGAKLSEIGAVIGVRQAMVSMTIKSIKERMTLSAEL